MSFALEALALMPGRLDVRLSWFVSDGGLVGQLRRAAKFYRRRARSGACPSPRCRRLSP
eukprot:CAMPEP_0119409664 /NCGR_PEP_ID=MMETSP1335-20130426/2901_1 /TAXON_ID=259385 /ORGANISM="Chrysoculter rhomboideus, Strain RCC1486" /LENGTH=58 /DNA_ID=CAMNT_0007434069 /DNA_START=63 /DNA_END=236 /DNA_ORIENTATION=-